MDVTWSPTHGFSNNVQISQVNEQEEIISSHEGMTVLNIIFISSCSQAIGGKVLGCSFRWTLVHVHVSQTQVAQQPRVGIDTLAALESHNAADRPGLQESKVI